VLGILAINIAGFAGPSTGTLTPNLPQRVGFANEAAWAFGFVLFEGKMRALFAILFGAGIALFCESTDRLGGFGELLQVRRLSWLMLFGMLHYLLLWWGDILFVYALCGMGALLLRRLPTGALLSLAFTIAVAGSLRGVLADMPLVDAEEAMRLGTATQAQRQDVLARLDLYWDEGARETALYAQGFLQIAMTKLREDPFWLVVMTGSTFTEVLPLMLLGVVLERHGFFAEAWPRSRLIAAGALASAAGLVMTLAALDWAWPRHFPPIAMSMLLSAGLIVPHAITAFGYAALLVLAAPPLARTAPGRRLIAAGRMAFSNYIGTSIVMTAIFYSWGLGLFGTIRPAGQWLFVALGWALMLGWSKPWLDRYRRGPLEWLWRSLVMRKPLGNRRETAT
jgi:uncharacterized protein